jgi:hypothetical protein
MADASCNQIGRSHERDELSINPPPSIVLEVLRVDPEKTRLHGAYLSLRLAKLV